MSARTRDRVLATAFPLSVFVLNIFITWRLLRSEFIDQLPSIEGAFVSLATYIQQHWPGYDWFPLWYGGYPFARAYQPALHYTVAGFAAVSGLSAASAYHFITAVTYSLAGVAFYFLGKTLGAGRIAAFCGALCFSVFSPSLLLLRNVREDAGGLWHARRLQALVQYGEGPNITGLMLGTFAIALLYAAIKRRKAGTAIAAALAIAAVPATNWPATVALCVGISCCLGAFEGGELRRGAGRIAGIGALAMGFALPFALPSTIWSTFHNANVMTDAPTAGPLRWLLLAGLLITLGVARAVSSRMGADYALRFALLYSLALCWIVLSAAHLHINLVPQPMRFHVAMEMPMVLAAVLAVQLLLRRYPRFRVAFGVALVVFCAVQTYHFRQHARTMAGKLDVSATVEYEEARWMDAHLHGQRVAAPGTVSFWMNVFTGTPQFAGCCEQSVVNPRNFIGNYIVGAGYRTDAESADYSLLWMKAWAVQAVAIGGPASREAYKAFQFPRRFEGRLPLLWSRGDDFIYRVPARAPGLARVVRAADLVRDAPENGIDARQLRPFVAALEDESLPLASFEWRGANAAHIEGVLQPEQVLSVAVNYHPGWTALVNRRPTPVRPDGLGLIALEPHCAGTCAVELRWSAGPESWLAIPVALLALVGALLWWWRGATGSAATDYR
jgi:hypothetical protein